MIHPTRAFARGSMGAYFALKTLHRAESNLSSSLDHSARDLQRACKRLLSIHAMKVSCTGTKPDGPCVYVANHLSYIDPIAVLSVCKALPIAKSSVEDWPMIGPGAKAMEVLFVKRKFAMNRAKTLRQSLNALRSGVSVLNFPEGTTTDGSDLLPFHRGIFGIAQIANVPVVPVTIHFNDRELCWIGDDTFLPHYVTTASKKSNFVSVHFSSALNSRASATPEALALRARRTIQTVKRKIEGYDPTKRSRVSTSWANPIFSVTQ